MKKFTLDLYKNIQRPVIYLADWHKFDAMLDTGALFPVWVDEEKALIKLDAECIKEKVTFGGFEGEAIGNLTIWDENGHLQVLCSSGDEINPSRARQ